MALGISLVQSLFCAASGAYLITIFMILYVYQRLRDPYIRRVLILAFLGFGYCLISLLLTTGPFDEKTATVLFTVVVFLGSMGTGVYIDVLCEYLKVSDKVLRWISRVLKFIAILIVVGSPFEIFVRPGGKPAGNWFMDFVTGSVHVTETGMLILTSSALITLVCAYIIIFKYWDKFKDDRLLTFGIFLTPITVVSDNLMGMGVPYLFSVFAFGFLFEILRFTMHIFVMDFDQREVLVEQIQNQIEFPADTMLIQKFTKDLGDCLSENKDLPSLQKCIEAVSRGYAEIHKNKAPVFKSPGEGFALLENIYKRQRPDLKIDFENLDTLAPEWSLSATDFYIIFGNLLQNSIDALENTDSPKVEIRLKFINNHHCVDFKDKGHGFSKEALRQAFHPGYSTKGEDRGKGLNVVREILFNYIARVEILEPKDGAHLQVWIPKLE